MNGNAPTLISGVPNVASSEATIRSQASAIPSAPASTCPRAAHSVGLPSPTISLNNPTKRSEPKCLCTSATSAAKPPRLAPEEKTVSCEEASTTTRTASSSRARSNEAIKPSSTSGDSALRVDGSFERDRGHAVGHLVEHTLVGHVRHPNRPAIRRHAGWPPSQQPVACSWQSASVWLRRARPTRRHETTKEPQPKWPPPTPS